MTDRAASNPPHGFSPGWAEMRVLGHVMQLKALPDPSDTTRLSNDPWFDRIDPRYRDRGRFFNGFGSAFAALGTMADELRLPFEPLHPLPAAELSAWRVTTLGALGAADPAKDYKLTALSRALVGSYNPAADLLWGLDGTPKAQDLFLYDHMTGFALWSDGTRTHNTWVGNVRDLAESTQQPAPLRRLLYSSDADHFNLGQSLLFRLIWPAMKRARPVQRDGAGIPTIIVETQSDLDALAEDILDTCRRAPLKVTAVFRGQTQEHHLPDRKDLVRASICPYSDVADHSLVPSLYRGYDQFQDQLADFRGFMTHLLDWGLWADLMFGNPARILTLDGRPYEPKPVPETATSSMAMAFSGQSAGGRGTNDMGPYTRWTIRDASGAIIDEYIKVFRPGIESARRNLVLQHYGAPTPFVDVTNDIRVAEWFALNTIRVNDDGLSTSGRVVPPFNDPAIYVLMALDGLTPLIDTHELVTPTEALRPHRQSCALIGGPGNLYRNSVSRFIGLKIKLADTFVPVGLPTADHLFPGPDEDGALKALLQRYRKPKSGPTTWPVYWFPRG